MIRCYHVSVVRVFLAVLVVVGSFSVTSAALELHGFWDDILGTSKKASSAETRAPTIKAAPAHGAAISDEGKWIGESFQAAKRYAYAAPIGPKTGPYTLDDHYKKAAGADALRRIALAGARLANLLNDALQ